MDFEKLNLSLVFLVSGASYQASYKAPFVLVVKRTSLTTDSKEAYTVNIYRYKAIGANATSSVISTTWKSLSPCLEIL